MTGKAITVWEAIREARKILHDGDLAPDEASALSWVIGHAMRFSGAALSALAAVLETFTDECDHAVNICHCDIRRTIKQLRAYAPEI